jgi:outer membrane protein assembly factor BamB
MELLRVGGRDGNLLLMWKVLVYGFAAAIALPILTAGGERSDSWPQFRGPNASGVSDSAKPPVKISPTNLVRWKVEVPWSPSSPAVWDDKIFLTAADAGALQTRCYDRNSGGLLWTKQVKPEKLEIFHRSEGSPAASTPATDGKRIVSYFGSFGVVCFDLSGKELWRHELPVAESAGFFGTGTSPIIIGDTAIVLRDQYRGSSLLALALGNGKTVWETPRPEAQGSFGTPIVWHNAGADEIVTPGSIRLNGYDAKTGAERWQFEPVTSFACPTPVARDSGMLYFAAWSPGKADSPWPSWASFLERSDKNKDGVIDLDEFDPSDRDFARGMDFDHDGKITKDDYDKVIARNAKGENVLVAIRPGGRGDISNTHLAWKFTRGLPYVPSPLLYQNRLYLMRDGMVTSLDAETGKPFYTQERINANGNYYASPVAADGHIYLISQPGKLTVIKAGGDQPEVLHQADFHERIFATPALVGRNLYLRTETKLYSFEG